MRALRWLYRLWTTPSDFLGDAGGYAMNQIGHGYAIGGTAAWFWGPPVLVPLVILYLAIVELPQLLLWGGDLADGIEDTAHVATVAVAVAYGIWPGLLAHLLFVIAGALARLERRP